MDKAIFYQWLDRKLDRDIFLLREPRSVSEKYLRITGPRCLYGEIVLRAAPSQTFEFKSEVTWPYPGDNYDNYVLEGILDTLLSDNLRYVLGASFVLEQIKWHEVDSCAIAYYHAARQATEKILGRGKPSENHFSPSVA